jgi:hypothetical protein
VQAGNFGKDKVNPAAVASAAARLHGGILHRGKGAGWSLPVSLMMALYAGGESAGKRELATRLASVQVA